MTARYLLLILALASSAFGDSIQVIDSIDLTMIAQETTAALKTSAAPQDVAADLRNRTYGKHVTVTEASIIDLSDMDALPVAVARRFAGVYTLGGKSYPEPSTLDCRQIAETLRGFLTFATWEANTERIRCSGAGLVVLNLKKDDVTFTYNLLASSYTSRRLRLGQLVSLEATISGVSVSNSHLDVFGVIRHVDEP